MDDVHKTAPMLMLMLIPHLTWCIIGSASLVETPLAWPKDSKGEPEQQVTTGLACQGRLAHRAPRRLELAFALRLRRYLTVQGNSPDSQSD